MELNENYYVCVEYFDDNGTEKMLPLYGFEDLEDALKLLEDFRETANKAYEMSSKEYAYFTVHTKEYCRRWNLFDHDDAGLIEADKELIGQIRPLSLNEVLRQFNLANPD